MKRENAFWITVVLVAILGGEAGRACIMIESGTLGVLAALSAAVCVGVLGSILWNKSWPPEEGD